MNKFAQYRTFIAIAKHGSLSAAGRALNITTSAVSKQLDNLEQALAVHLVDRTHKNISITPAGLQFEQSAREILEQIQQSESALLEGESSLSGSLQISLSKSLIRSEVAQWLFAFMEINPNIQLNISATDDVVDLYQSNTDFALRLGRTGGSTRIYQTKLKDTRLICAASQDYVNKYGQPKSLSALREHRIMQPPNQQMSAQLRNTLGRSSVTEQWRNVQIVDDIELIYQAVDAGVAISFFLDITIHQELKSGRWLSLLPDAKLPEKALYLLRKKTQHESKRVRCLRSHLLAQRGL